MRDFLYVKGERSRMEFAVRERLDGLGGPFIVIGHSQGSMVAYEVLRKLTKRECDVRLFVTLGSPLGLQEVQDELGKWRPLAVPECVDRWINFAERLDPVALDAELASDFATNAAGVAVEDTGRLKLNPDWKSNPHSATGYLRIPEVRDAVRETAGAAFAQRGRPQHRDEGPGRGHRGRRVRGPPPHAHPARGRRRRGDCRAPRSTRRAAGRGDDRRVPEGKPLALDAARIQHMRRFLSADLTRQEIERLRSSSGELKIERVWRNAVKRALLHQSSQTVQAKPANLGYGARGQGIAWAVLDTGIWPRTRTSSATATSSRSGTARRARNRCASSPEEGLRRPRRQRARHARGRHHRGRAVVRGKRAAPTYSS